MQRQTVLTGLGAALVLPLSGGRAAGAAEPATLWIGNVPIDSSSDREKGLPLKIIASGSTYPTKNPTTVMLVPNASTLRSARDLNGKTEH